MAGAATISTTELTLTGPVREIYFGMPHCTAVVEADGKAWDRALAPLSRMTSRGLRRARSRSATR